MKCKLYMVCTQPRCPCWQPLPGGLHSPAHPQRWCLLPAKSGLKPQISPTSRRLFLAWWQTLMAISQGKTCEKVLRGKKTQNRKNPCASEQTNLAWEPGLPDLRPRLLHVLQSIPAACQCPDHWQTTESQNHRVAGVGRDLCGSPSPTPCPSRVTQSRLHSTASRRVLNISRVKEREHWYLDPCPALRRWCLYWLMPSPCCSSWVCFLLWILKFETNKNNYPLRKLDRSCRWTLIRGDKAICCWP